MRDVMTQKEKPKKCSMGEGDFLSMAYTPLGANGRKVSTTCELGLTYFEDELIIRLKST